MVAASAVAGHETQSPPPLDGPASPDLPAFTEDAQAIAWTRDELPTIREAIGRAWRAGRSDIARLLATGLFGYATAHWWTGEWDACLRTTRSPQRTTARSSACCASSATGSSWPPP
ncbi:hypothetical protein [Streptomyces sp. NPDC057689]|uniref:hypothetical protein n=1 Tax=Streptomyces sp. NPDC057689 TaxID=3346213 RepID=UPI0036BDD8B6